MQTRMARAIFVGAVLTAMCVIVACSATTLGRKIDTWQVNAIKKGQTTKSQVIASFGQPSSRTNMGGSEMWTYHYSRASGGIGPGGMLLSILTLGLYTPVNVKAEQQMLTVSFAGDVVSDVSYYEGADTGRAW
jgi:outer membrane protein assembly factor BamE (lipoprotein component of BamABCDE complex)